MAVCCPTSRNKIRCYQSPAPKQQQSLFSAYMTIVANWNRLKMEQEEEIQCHAVVGPLAASPQLRPMSASGWPALILHEMQCRQVSTNPSGAVRIYMRRPLAAAVRSAAASAADAALASARRANQAWCSCCLNGLSR